MKTINQYLNFCAVIALITAGAILLAVDFPTPSWSLVGAAVLIAAGWFLGRWFDKKHMLPE
jgi:hypothetical protein